MRIDPEPTRRPAALPSDPTWYKDAIIYELHVRAFHDSNGDGVGDLPGLIEKLDYLRDLGVTALWLLPFYPSPLRDGGYDIADYTAVNPAYGTLDDFRRLLDEAHKRGLRIITELVLNHTSVEHAWFQRARRAPPGSPERDYYVWSDTPERYQDARIIFTDFETSNWAWDPVAKAYYWHRFYSHQPDLNFDNPAVEREMFRVVDFWLELGVDGMRLDAVPYLYEREGTSCENLPETHEFLRRLRAHVDQRYADRMLLAEANQWPSDAAAYFGAGDECHMNFHFPLMPRMFMAVQLEDRFPIVDVLRQTPSIADACQWATFLRNHDELTLEMVTDEDRDFMVRAFADEPVARINLGIRRRLAPLMKQRRKVELMHALLLSLPGTPVLYYGDEIGMGDNIYLGDRDGVRTPMQWSPDRNAGFSRAPSQRLYLPVITDSEYHFEATNVQTQQQNPSSLLWWMKRLIALRNQHKVFGRGDLAFVGGTNDKVLAFVRSWQGERVLVAANLSRFPQHTYLDLSGHVGLVPVEAFGSTRFPRIHDAPYSISFGPYGFYWFTLEPERIEVTASAERRHTLLRAPGGVAGLVAAPGREFLRALEAYLGDRRWFRGKARQRKEVSVADAVALPGAVGGAHVVFLRVDYVDGDPDTYLLGLAVATGDAARALEERSPNAIIARLVEEGGVLHDVLAVADGGDALLAAMRAGEPLAGRHGALALQPLSDAELLGQAVPRATVPEVEQSNSIFVFGEKIALKVMRLVEEGPNPEVEMGAFLAGHTRRHVAPRLAASLEYRAGGKPPAVIALAEEYVPNRGVAWHLALDTLGRAFERALAVGLTAVPRPPRPWLARARTAPPPEAVELAGGFLDLARVLGRRTAEMHLALLEGKEPAFAPESFSGMHAQSIYQRARTMLTRVFDVLRRRAGTMPPATAELARALLPREADIQARLRRVTTTRIDALRIRHHGDLHLGQVLCAGEDVVIIDFEGEPARPLHERRYKRGALRDVTGMLRSFQYAAASALRTGKLRSEDVAALAGAARAWHEWVGGAYLAAYLGEAGGTRLVPSRDADRELMLEFYALEKCIYEVGYELNNRPDWLDVPLTGMLELLEEPAG